MDFPRGRTNEEDDEENEIVNKDDDMLFNQFEKGDDEMEDENEDGNKLRKHAPFKTFLLNPSLVKKNGFLFSLFFPFFFFFSSIKKNNAPLSISTLFLKK